MKKILLIIVSILLFSGCGKKEYDNPIVTMNIKDYGTIKIELYPKYAPNTVANFVNLIPEFVLQGGDPNGDGTGGPGYTINGEFRENGYTKNTLHHTTGIISMARTTDADSAGSQFFIVLADSESVTYSLDNKYAAFGKVIQGMDVIKNIEDNSEIENTLTGKLKTNITIEKVTVDTFGKDYEVIKNDTK